MNANRTMELVLVALLLALAVYIQLHIFLSGGVGWDFVSHYLNAKAMLESGFYNASAANTHNSTIQNHAMHYGKERAPLAQTIMYAILLPLYNLGYYSTTAGIGAYIIVLYVLLGVLALYAAWRTRIKPLLLLSFIVSPFLLRYLVIYNSAEFISLAFLLAYIAALYRKSPWAGAIIALASLAKYTSIIFIPMLLFLERGKLKYALLLFAAFTLPWLVFSQIFFSSPFASYAISFAESQVSLPLRLHTPAFELSYILFYPLAITAAAVLYAKAAKGRISIRKDGRMLLKISAVMLMLAALLYAFAYRSTTIPTRFGYAIYLSLSIIAAVLVNETAGNKAVFLVFLFSMLSLLAMGPYTTGSINKWGMLSNSEFLASASNTIAQLNLSSCDVITNAWTWLRYYNISAYDPYYYDEPGYNPNLTRMPIIVFYNTGVPANQVRTYNVAERYNYSNMSILLPANYICSRS